MSSSRLIAGDFGEEIARLHERLATHGLKVSPDERKRTFFGPSTREAVSEFQKTHGIDPSCEVCGKTAAQLAGPSAAAAAARPGEKLVPTSTVFAGMGTPPQSILVDPGRPPLPGNHPGTGGGGSERYHIEGRIFFDHGLPAGGVTLRLYNRGFGGADALLGETKTDDQGFYALAYDPGGKSVNIEVRAVNAPGKEIPLSATKFNAGKSEVLNLVAPASLQPLAAEYQRLTADLGGLGKLAEARESDGRQDLTILHQATGWDARLLAIATNAVKLSTDTGIPQEALYALFRAGLPTDKQQLAQVSVGAVEKALGKAKEAGIVSLDEGQIAGTKAAFATFARTTLLAAKAPGALSSFNDLLTKAGVNEAQKLNATQKNEFADLYFAHRGTDAELWQKAQEKGIPPQKINALRLQGKLAFLTLNNADLAASLQQEIGSMDKLSQLVDKDLYQKEAWKNRLNQMAGNNEQALEKLIPPAYTAEKIADRLEAYAGDLAQKVCRSFPTPVVERKIAKGELRIGGQDEVKKKNLVTFLNNAVGLGFALGRTPVEAFVRKNEDKLFQGLQPEAKDETIKSVKHIQRLYQVTPTDEALKVALDLGFTSARDIVAYSKKDFLDRFGGRFPSQPEAQLVYRKAQQVSAVTYSFFTMAKQLDSTPSLYAMSPPAAQLEEAKNNLIKHFPTMESLFGSLDFCECEHCRSVLSPAAYFVDLLQFLDCDELVWNHFLEDWKTKHNGQSFTDKYKKPYDALIERRPDLPHLPLTCENTNTVLPYIDVVNEILEYYVANDKLAAEAVHDTGEATTPELLAEPQNVIPIAYDKLKEARYPLVLPFDLWLETVRRFFDHFETPLWQVLEIFRPDDELFAPAANPKPYYRAAIFAEYLGLSPAEHAIFTDPNPLAKWFELYGYATETEALTALKSAKTLSRRLGVSYIELVDLVRTGFVNPRLNALVILQKLGVEAEDWFRYKGQAGYPRFSTEEKKAFENQLADFGKPLNLSLNEIKAQLENVTGNMNEILLLADPNTGCNFDQTIILYASHKNAYANGEEVYTNNKEAYALVFLKINLFVRLWKKLGWTIEETDRALQAFLPKNSNPLTAANLGAALKTALLYCAHLKTLNTRVNVGKSSLLKLLTLWSNLPTTGKNPLYAQFFLTRSVLQNDAVFDDPLGNYLAKAGILLKDHLLALQAALNLTADEVGRILADAGKNLETAELSLDNVSRLYRCGLLARALKLPVRDLIALKALSGLDPFKPLKAAPLAVLAENHPFTQTLRFVEVAQKVKDSGFKVEDLDYLLRHRFDPVGKYRLNPEALVALVKTLAAEIRRIQTEHAIPDDPAAFTDEVLRQKLALALPPEVAETFLAMWTGKVEYEVVQENVQAGDGLKPEDFSGEAAIRKVSYNKVSHEQSLTFQGVLLNEEMARLKNAHASSAVFAALLDAVRKKTKTFFEDHFQKHKVDGSNIAGFLEQHDFDLLFAPIPAGLSDKEKQEKINEKREKLAQAFLPYLQRQLIRQSVVQTLATNLSADPALVEALLTEPGLLTEPDQPGKKLLEAFAAAGDRGLTLTFFASSDGTGAPLNAPNGANSARWEGYLEAPTTGPYRFFVMLGKKDAEAELRFAHLPDPLIQDKAGSDGAEISQFVELKAGVPYQFTLLARHLDDGEVDLRVLGENLPKGSLGRLMLYPQAAFERVQRAQVLLEKTLQLIQELGLTEREVRYLLTHAADFDNLDLSKLPTREADDSPAGATALLGQFLRLADYVRMKRELAAGTDDFVGIFENARHLYPASTDANQAKTALLNDLCKRVADLTRREIGIVQAAAQHLGFNAHSALVENELRVEAPDFAQEKGLWRLCEVLQVVEKLGVPVDAIFRWATPAPDFAIARDLKNTVKARYEQENWQRLAQSIFDKLRQRQRDALAAYIMPRHGFDRLEQLFEYFLIDPGMEPVVQTSRLRLAISSAQLFIQRCLLNLEAQVHPSTINSKHWQWMKRYRVWEANRKIFLFPENWLEPEFRDDKTHLFQELESALLQGDVSNDLAEDAFFNYLKKLEELARLDLVTMYCEEKPDPASNTLHVIGRTFNLPYKYFYRRYAHQMWTPWEPVTTEIEGDHLAAVVWRDRLHLFWVTFLEKAKQDPNKSVEIDPTKKFFISQSVQKEVEVQLNWSEYFQGQWTTRESSGFDNPIRVLVGSSFNSREVSMHVSKELEGEEEQAVKIHLHFKQTIPEVLFLAVSMMQILSTNATLRRDTTLRRKRTDENGTSDGGEIPDGGGTHGGGATHGGGGVFDGGGVVNAGGTPSVDVPRDIAFRLVSKNSLPQVVDGDRPQPPTYAKSDKGALQVIFVERISTEDGQPPQPQEVHKDIIQQSGNFSLLMCGNRASLPTPEFGALTSPFFYQDDRHTLFVEPTLFETTIEQWEKWVVPTPRPDPMWEHDEHWENAPIEAEVPATRQPFPMDQIDSSARFKFQPKEDWLTNPATVLQFDGRFVGRGGGLDVSMFAAESTFGAPVHVSPGSVLGASGGAGATVTSPGGGLNVIAGGGLNSVVLRNLKARKNLEKF